MKEYTAAEVATLIEAETQSSLEAMLREGARRMLPAALEMEGDAYIAQCQGQRDGLGQRLVVRKGRHRAREVVTGVGKIPIRQPRVDDQRAEHHFASAILPPYLRRTPSVDALIPTLYLKGWTKSSKVWNFAMGSSKKPPNTHLTFYRPKYPFSWGRLIRTDD